MNKKCFKCNKRKPESSFYRHSQMGDGLLGKCKLCTKKDVAHRYKIKIDKIKEYERLRSKEPKRKASAEQYQKNRRKRNPGIIKARSKINSAIRDGRAVRGPCFVCGATNRIEAHHQDYRKPLDVLWVCRKHHLELHGKNCWLED